MSRPRLSQKARGLVLATIEAERACGDRAVADAIEFLLEQHDATIAADAASSLEALGRAGDAAIGAVKAAGPSQDAALYGRNERGS